MKLLLITITALMLDGFLSGPAVALEIQDAIFTTGNAGKVVFSHDTHLKKKNRTSPNVGCKSCHNDKMIKNIHYTMAQMEHGKSCGQCHNGKRAFALANCTSCHKVRNITYRVRETGPVLFSHTAHLKKQGCKACHNSIFKISGNPKAGMADMEKGKSCGACHNGKTAFSLASCTVCHPVKELVFTIKGAGNTTFSHISHVEMFKCGECHAKYYPAVRSRKMISMAEMESGKSCGGCHDGKAAFTVKANCATCHKIQQTVQS